MSGKRTAQERLTDYLGSRARLAADTAVDALIHARVPLAHLGGRP